jgi:hypothetical protein
MKKELAAKMVLGSSEVQEMLLISKSRLNALVEEGKLQPMKELKREYLFWLPEIEAFKKALLLDSRSNLYKQQKGDARKHA